MNHQKLIQKLNLHSYQESCLDFVLHTPRCGLFLPVGAGKTRIVLAAIAEINPSCHILVVAPAPIARISWKEEIEATGLPIEYKSFMTGPRGGKTLPKAKRYKLYEQIETESPKLYTISRELLKDLIDWHKNNKKSWPFHFLVIDELQSFKNHRSERFLALKSVILQTYRFIGLTGTPAPKGIIDLWPQIYLMDAGQRLGRTITKYRNTFFNEGIKINGQTVTWNPKPLMPVLDENLLPETDCQGNITWTAKNAEKEIYDRIKDLVVSIDISDFLKLPERIEAVHKIELDPAEKTAYDQFVKEKVLEFETENGEGEEVTAASAAILAQKLTQLASGSVYTDENHTVVRFHDKKLDMLKYIVDNEPTPILVAYYFRSDLDAILKTIPDAIHFSGEPRIKEKWDRGEIHVMVMHPASVGFGLNLQKGGHTLVWYTMPWSLEHYEQTEGRIYRQGQDYTTVMHYLITKGTIDEKIMRVLQMKQAKQEDLLNAVRLTISEEIKNEAG